MKFDIGDVLFLKKPHPCKEHRFEVLRIGSDIRIRCLKCQRDVTVPREKLEKSVKSIEKKP